MRSFISGVSFKVGSAATIDHLISEAREGAPEIESLRERGLRHYCVQAEPTLSMCTTVLSEALSKAGLEPDQIGTVLVDADSWYRTHEDRVDILESLHRIGLVQIPVLGVSLQTCSGTLAAFDLADKLLRAGPRVKPIMILACGRSGASRIELGRTVVSDGVAACVVSTGTGCFDILASTVQTALDMARSSMTPANETAILLQGCARIAQISQSLYADAHTSAEDIEALFCTNTNLMHTSFAARAARVQPSRTYNDNIAAFGHVTSCDHLINLATFEKDRGFQAGGKYLLLGWSPYVFGGSIISYTGPST